MPLAATHMNSAHVQSETDKATSFIEQIQHIRQQVHDIMEKSNAKYKQRHDQHWVPHKFQVGDKVWLHLQKERLTGAYRKLRTLRYLSSTFPHSLACPQCSMWTAFGHTFHHY